MPDDQVSPLEAINSKFGLAAPSAPPVTAIVPVTEPIGELSPLDSINQKFGLKLAISPVQPPTPIPEGLPPAATGEIETQPLTTPITGPQPAAAVETIPAAPKPIPFTPAPIPKEPEAVPPGGGGGGGYVEEPRGAAARFFAPQAPTPPGKVERLGRQVVAGALGTAEGMGGALQWITGGAMGKDFSDYMADLRKQVTPEGEASFAEQLASGAGSMATFFIPGFGVARGLGIAARVAPKAAAWLGAGTMAVTEAATEAGQVYRDELGKGINQDKASGSANWTFWLNLPVLTLTDKLAFFGNQGKALSRALRGMVMEGSQESLQEVISTWSKDEQQNLKNILTSGAVGALLGGGVGAIAKPAPDYATQRREKEYYEQFLTEAQKAKEAEGIPRTEYGGAPGAVIGEAPAVAPILDQFGRPASPDEVQAALAKQSFERNAHEKFLADQAQKEAKEEILPTAAPGKADITPGTAVRERANVGEEAVDRLQRAVDIVGDSNAGKKLGALLAGNQKTLADAFRVGEEVPGLAEITQKVMDLAQKVEDTGEPGAAKELHDYINSNLKALKSVVQRWPEVVPWPEIDQPMPTAGAPPGPTPTAPITPRGEVPPASAPDMISRGQPAVNPAGRSNEVPESLPKEGPRGEPRFAPQAAAEPPSGAPAQVTGGGNVALSPTPAGVPKKRGALVAPKTAMPEQPMGAGVKRTGVELGVSQVGKADTSILETRPYSASADIKSLRDFSESDAFRKEGLSGFDVPTQRAMMGRVLTALKDPQIRDDVIKTVPVDVVDNLIGVKSPSDVSLHDQSTLNDHLTIDADGRVSLRSDKADLLVRSIASSIAEREGGSLESVGGPLQEGSTVTAENRTAGFLKDTSALTRAEKDARLILPDGIWFSKDSFPADIASDIQGAIDSGHIKTSEDILERISQTKGKSKSEVLSDYPFLAASEKAQLLKKATDAGAQQGLPGMGGVSGAGGLFAPPPANGKRYSIQEARQYGPVFYSQMQAHLETKLPGKGSGADLANLIEGWGAKGQFKADELKWSGLVPWLKEQKGTVTKQQVADFLKENQVEVREVEKGKREPTEAQKQEIERLQDEARELGKKWRSPNTPDGMRKSIGEEVDRITSQIQKIERQDQTKFSGFMRLPPGGENYRELLLTVPVEGKGDALVNYENQLKKKYGAEYVYDIRNKITDAELTKLEWLEKQFTTQGEAYKVPGSHAYGDTAADVNRFAHIFMDDRVIDGKKYLTIWEMQSDWAGEGRRKGYLSTIHKEKIAELEGQREKFINDKKYYEDTYLRPMMLEGKSQREIAKAPFHEGYVETQNIIADYDYKINQLKGGVPDLPFAKNWHEVALKKALRMAAEEGYDGVAWATGDMVKERYDISKQVDTVWYSKHDAQQKGRVQVVVKKDNGVVFDKWLMPEELPNFIGKDIADRIVNSGKSHETLSGLDLKIGGEWANRQYDQMMPQFLNKYGKQWGARVGEGKVGGGINYHDLRITEDPDGEYYLQERGKFPDTWNTIGFYKTKEDATDAMGAAMMGDPIHTLPITPEMKESVLTKGQPLYRAEGEIAPTLRPEEAVTLETVKREMGKAGYLVKEAEVGDATGYHITLPNGKMIFVITGKEFTKPSLEDIQRTYPDMTREKLEKSVIAGEWQPMSLGGIAYLAKEAGVGTFRHEVGLHGAADLVLTDREMKALLRDYGDWEAAARAYEAYDPRKGPDNPLFRKIWEFFRDIMHLIRPTGESTFEQIASGEVWLRKEVGPGTYGVPFAPARYKLTPEEKAAEREARKEAGIPNYRDFYKNDLQETSELYQRLKTHGNRDVPLYEGQEYTKRAGLQIKDEKGKVRFLSKKEIYEHFYDRQKPYATGTKVPMDPRVVPEGTIEPPPERTVLRSLKEKISVGNLSDKADYALHTVIEHTGWSAREAEKDFAVLDKYERLFQEMDQGTFVKYMDIAERGELGGALERGEVSPEFVQAMQAWRRISDGLHYLWSYETESKAEAKRAEGKSVRPEDAQVAYWTDYYARNFENPEMASHIIASTIQSRKPGGPAGFRQARTQLLLSDSIKPKLEVLENNGQFDVVKKSLYGEPDETMGTFTDRAAAQEMVDTQGGLGLRLIDQNNYVNVMKGNVWEKLRWLQDTYMVNDQKEAGFVGKKQPGWVALADKGLTKGLYAHPDVAKVWDKYLSAGMRNDPIFRAYYSPFTMMQEVFVGFSAFHASFSTLSYLSHGVGMNLPRAIGAALSGDFSRAGKHIANLGKAFYLPGEFALSRRLAEEYRHPGTHPTLSPYVDLLTAGGIRIQDNGMLEMGRTWKENREQMVQSFVDVWKDNKLGIPRWMIKKMASPIMNYVVPSFKLVAQFRRLEMELDRASQDKGSPLTREEQVRIAQDVSSEADNIYGQMVYDNLGMTRGMKDMLSLLIGFPGWNIGSFTKLGYTVKGLSHLAKESAKAGGELLVGRKPTWEKMDRQSRMGVEFYTGMVLIMAVGGTILQRLLAGEWPEDTKDLFMPRTGDLLPNGQPERMRLPTYMRDVLSLKHPIEMVKHKLPFPIRLFNELVDNKNYFGEQIRDPWASVGEQGKTTAEYLAKSMLPFGVQGMLKTQSPTGKYLNIIGITPMPRAYTNTPAQNVIDEYNQMMRASMTTKETAEKKKLKSDLMKLARDQDEAGFKEATDSAVAEGKITRQQVKEIVEESQAPPGMSRFVRLPLEWALRAWDQASDQEKEQWHPYFLKKIMGEKPENLIRLREPTVDTLRGMGLDTAADAVANLAMPEETGIDLTGLGLLKPAPETAGAEAVDAAIAEALTKSMEPRTRKTGVRLPGLYPREKKKPYSVLGL